MIKSVGGGNQPAVTGTEILYFLRPDKVVHI